MPALKKEQRIIREFFELISGNEQSESLVQAMNIALDKTYDEVKHLQKVIASQNLQNNKPKWEKYYLEAKQNHWKVLNLSTKRMLKNKQQNIMWAQNIPLLLLRWWEKQTTKNHQQNKNE